MLNYAMNFFIPPIILEVIIFPDIELDGEISITNISFKTQNEVSTMTQIVKYQTFLEWANYTNSYHILWPNNATSAFFFYPMVIAREFSTFIHIENAYCSPIKEIASQKHLIKLYERQITFYKNDQAFVEHGYKNIIFLYSTWGNVFGHFIHDSLTALLKFPKDLIDKSMIMISFNYDIACQYFDLFNISRDKLLYNKSYWYFAKNLYLHYSYERCLGYLSITFPRLITLLREKTGVNNIVGHRYIFSNRPKGRRHVDNLEEFYNMTKFQFPEYEWEFDRSFNYHNLSEISHTFATFKLLITPTGSNVVNVMYMNKNYTTGVCLIFANTVDHVVLTYFLVMEQWGNGFSNKWGHQQWDKEKNCDIPYGLTCIRRLLYALKYKKWPNSTFNDMKEAFDLHTINKLARNNYRLSTLITYQNNTFSYPKHFGAYLLK